MRNIRCDVAIIGSGFGGATVAYALSRAGLKTVLVERGGWPARDDDDWDALKVLIDKRYHSESPVRISQYGKPADDDYLNEVVGGLSVFYGAATLRLREADFEQWPIDYDDLEPYYAEAERLYEVCGTAGLDPFEPARSTGYPFALPDLTPPALRIHRAGEKLGYHPFPVPMAIHYSGQGRRICANCITCDGFPCKIEAKNDTVVTALRKADSSLLTVIPETIAARLVEQNGRITSIECINRESGECLCIEADQFVLSGGAIHSPALLMRSGLDRFDRSGALGRYLMRHCNAIVGALFPFRVNPHNENHKQIVLTDFYEDMREEFGTSVGIIQDMCMPPATAVRYLAPRGLGHLAAFFLSGIQSLLCIAEDEPRIDNRVLLGGAKDKYGLQIAKVQHEYSANDIRRRDYLVKRTKRILRKAGGMFPTTRLIDSFSHAVGSVRFGDSPETAVLNPDCRFFDIPNLFVVDGSIFPTSGGVNPSLTIAAIALRAADRIKANH